MRLFFAALILMIAVSAAPARACLSTPTVFFDLNSIALSPEGTRILSEFVRQPGGDWQDFEAIIVIGHSDRTGSKELRERIGVARASAVGEMLMAYGVPSRLIRAVGASDREPLLATPDHVADPRNRRVEIRIVWTKAAQAAAAAQRDEAIKTGTPIPIC